MKKLTYAQMRALRAAAIYTANVRTTLSDDERAALSRAIEKLTEGLAWAEVTRRHRRRQYVPVDDGPDPHEHAARQRGHSVDGWS
jgi:hypothetical protein